jgi:hypothetical protein
MSAIFKDAAGNVYTGFQVNCLLDDGNPDDVIQGAYDVVTPYLSRGWSVVSCWIYDENGFRTPVTLFDPDAEMNATRPSVPDIDNVTGYQYSGVVTGSPYDSLVVGGYTWTGPANDYGSSGWAFTWRNGAAQDYYHDRFTRTGGGFFSGLPSIVQNALTVIAATAGFGVGAASGANLAVNVTQGNPLSENAGLAAGLDVTGLVAGEGIAAALAPSGELVGAATSEVILPTAIEPVVTADYLAVTAPADTLIPAAALDPVGLSAADAAGVAATAPLMPAAVLTPAGAAVLPAVPIVAAAESIASKVGIAALAGEVANLTRPPASTPTRAPAPALTPAPGVQPVNPPLPLGWLLLAGLAFKVLSAL